MKEDYDRLIPFLEEKIKKHGKIKWYFEMEDFRGFEVQVLWEDVKFDVKHRNSFEKVAMVGDKMWHKLMTDMMKPFTDAEIKYFDLKDQDKAHHWIKEA